MTRTIKILGINSSPIKNGNTAFLLAYALREAKRLIPEEGLEVESVSLAGLTIGDCCHCNWCSTKQTHDKLCLIEDDAVPILGKIAACDVLILASPVYFARLSGLMACLIDRTRCFIRGAYYQMALKGKIGVALAVAWGRNCGLEPTLESLHNTFLLHEMLTPTAHAAGVICGVGAVSGGSNIGEDELEKISVSKDTVALRATALLMEKVLKGIIE